MPTTRRRRFGAIAAVLALLSTMAVLAIGAQPASADTVQNYACFSPLTSTYATFPIPVTGSGAPDPILPGDNTTFSNLSVSIAIDSGLVIAGIGAGVLTFVTDSALIGSVDPNSGGDGVNAAVNTTTMDYTASNTVETTASAAGGVTITFFVAWDGADPLTLQIYVETSPGSWDGSGTDGLVQVPVLPVPIALSPNVTVTGVADGTIDLAGALGPLPANPAGAPSIAERNNAPLILLNNLGVSANFYCWPGVSQGPFDPVTGLPDSSPGFTPAPTANTIDSVTVFTPPPESPECSGETTSAPAGQSILIDLTDNCTDANGDLDLTTLTPTAPTAGTLTPTATPGIFSYQAPGTDPGVPATFSFTVDDLEPSTPASAPAVVSISILGNLCDATLSSCALSQVLILPVVGTTRTLEQAGGSVTLIDAVPAIGPDLLPGTADDPLTPQFLPIFLNGQPQLAVGQLNQMTVTNALGTDAPWSLTGQVTAFITPGAPTCTSAPASWNNHCIPGDNLGWSPSAAVAHQQVLGDVADVDAGSPLPLPPGFYGSPDLQATGMASGRVLCSSPVNQSGGTFTCDAGLALSVPASAAAGVYTATLTLTLA